MTKFNLLKVVRFYSFSLTLIWLVNYLFILVSQADSYLFNRPSLGMVMLFLAIHQHMTAKGWDKFFMWLLISLASLLWSWSFTVLFPLGLALTSWQVLAISFSTASVGFLAHVCLNKGGQS